MNFPLPVAPTDDPIVELSMNLSLPQFRIPLWLGLLSILASPLAVAGTRPLPSIPVSENQIAPRPTLVPIPTALPGVAQGVIPITAWKTAVTPAGEYWQPGADVSVWRDIQSGGGRRGGGGFGGGGGSWSAYRTEISIPADYAGRRVILRFDGVSNAAVVWVNGKFVRNHWGSLMAWSCDITPDLIPGQPALVTLQIDDRPLGLAAFVRAGGLQRDVQVYAVPADYVSRFHVETGFDPDYRDATLQVWLRLELNASDRARVKLTLKDDQGAVVPLASDLVEITRATPEVVASVPVPHPRQWDAEHPNLYTLEASVLGADGTPQETVSRTFGFREVKVVGNRFLVNGREVKFRGVWDGAIAQLKSQNVNHTRQKWVTEQLLADADRLGMYVLDENPVDFAKFGPESDPQFRDQYLDFTADLLERDRDHPSVIMWGLGNESFSGPNVLRAFHYAQAEDRQRPAMFSWANRVPTDEELPYSVYSSHYPDLTNPDLDLGGYSVAKWHSPSLPKLRMPVPVMPVLHDEYSHVVLNQAVISRDPNVRNFWGDSLQRFWEKMFVTPGALGGDIFGVDRMPEPYAFLIRKAYSPVRIANAPLPNPGSGHPLELAIKNWYDHTNFSELKIAWAVGDETGTLAGPDLAPHAAGQLTLPARAWRDGDQLSLKFYEAAGRLVDEFLLAINPTPPRLPVAQGPAPKLEETAAEIIITGADFKVVFDKSKGLIRDATVGGRTVLIDGPYLDLTGSGLSTPEWWCDCLAAHTEGNEVVVEIKGNYAIIAASFQVRIDGTGLITTRYTIDHLPGEPPPPTFSPWDATSVGGYSEVGVSYLLPASAGQLSWNRRALWTVYPDSHLGRPTGTAAKGGDDFRATKENIYSATVAVDDSGVTALSDGRDAVRVWPADSYRVFPGGVRVGIHNEWNYENIGLGNYAKPPLLIRSGYTGTTYLRLGLPAATP